MRPAFLALAGAAALSTAFAAAQALAFAAMLAVPVVTVGIGEAHAATDTAPALYRWTEPDGSLTFSPTPPTDGTPHERVDPMTMRPVGASGGQASGLTRTPTSENAASLVRATSDRPATTGDVAPAAGSTPTGFTRPSSVPTLGAAVRRPANGAPGGDIRAPDVPTTDGSRVVASNDKARRCSDLGKRVVSLERRLATPLTPEAMDDTVVQIARYQQSVERYCR